MAFGKEKVPFSPTPRWENEFKSQAHCHWHDDTVFINGQELIHLVFEHSTTPVCYFASLQRVKGNIIFLKILCLGAHLSFNIVFQIALQIHWFAQYQYIQINRRLLVFTVDAFFCFCFIVNWLSTLDTNA